jgi:L-ascorbate metabolism protein UlaG (beta-lactamase superfamily)
MRWWLCILAIVLAVLGFVLWLGWGRSGQWAEVTGWSQLSTEERAWAQQGATDYLKLENAPHLEWLGHATLQVEWGGLSLLTDPVNSGRVKVAPRLFAEPVLIDSEPVDAILISHAHMDHLDNATLARLPSTRLYLPAGSERFLTDAVRARHEVVPVQLWEPLRLGALEIIPVPAAHGGWRYPWQRGLFACGYVVRQGEASLYVAGDTAAGAPFAEIRSKYAPRYAVLPIGAYSPEWFLRCRHLNPEEALDVAAALGAEYVIPYHFGTFRLSLEPVDEPLRRFAQAALSREQKWFLRLQGLHLTQSLSLSKW